MSQWHLTTGELAVFSPMGLILGAVLAYIATRGASREGIATQKEIAKENLMAQRQLAQDERLWSMRATLYVELIGVLDSAGDLMIVPIHAEDEELNTRLEAACEEIDALSARIHAYAGDWVVKQYNELTAGMYGLGIRNPVHIADRPNIFTANELFIELLGPVVIKLRNAVRSEVQTGLSPSS
jgi:hypothetical protein